MPFECSRCGNQDLTKVGLKAGHQYCRACIQFPQETVTPTMRDPKIVAIQLGYALTEQQRLISEGLLGCYRKKQSAMVDAVTGSGKTEIVFSLIQVALAEGKRIGFVIPRRDVVQELAPRFQSVFPNLTITSVFGGHHETLEGDLVVLTTHQLYRYHQYFDVLIFDEVDAFPYHGNAILEAFVKRSTNGIIVYLSATFTKETLVAFTNQGGKVFNLYHRYHGYPIPILTYQLRPFFLKWIEIVLTLHSFRKANQPVFIFVPTIALGKLLLFWLVLFFPNTKFVYSSSKSRSETIAFFKQNPTFFLITTAILERGITVPHLQVIIFCADHVLFTTSMLIQMAGRVGRKVVSPSGKVIAFADRMTHSIRQANAKIQFANAHL